MSAIPRPSRMAMPGETVNFFESGDPTEVPIPAIVHTAYNGSIAITFHRMGHPAVQTKTAVKHMHDPYWDAVSVQNKQANGAYDFHPVFKGVFDKHASMAVAREARRAKLESERTELSVDEFNAITALEKHGDNISAISEETGLTPVQLKKLVRFNEELRLVKDAAFAAKNAD